MRDVQYIEEGCMLLFPTLDLNHAMVYSCSIWMQALVNQNYFFQVSFTLNFMYFSFKYFFFYVEPKYEYFSYVWEVITL